jgi:TetR/AcrR family tetracycline transcriptional repressor
VARPKIPLISRRDALERALRIVGDEGLDALSIRRLAEDMNVNGASFYHHFDGKDDILWGAARLALSNWRSPGDELGQDYVGWLTDLNIRYRQGLLSNPNIVPVLLSRHPLEIGLDIMDGVVVKRMLDAGVPRGAVMPILEAMEAFALGSVLYRTATQNGDIAEWKSRYPNVHAVAADAELGDDEVYELVAQAMVTAIIDGVKKKQARLKRAARRAAGSAPAAARSRAKSASNGETSRSTATRARKASSATSTAGAVKSVKH